MSICMKETRGLSQEEREKLFAKWKIFPSQFMKN
jgi:hypothetical protein